MAKKKELTPAEKEQKRQLKNLKERLRYYEHKGYDISDFNIPSSAPEMLELRGQALLKRLGGRTEGNISYSPWQETESGNKERYKIDTETGEFLGIERKNESLEVEEIDPSEYQEELEEEASNDEDWQDVDYDFYGDYIDGREYSSEYDESDYQTPVFDIFSFLEEKIDEIPDYKEYQTRYQHRKNQRGVPINLSPYKSNLRAALSYRVEQAKANNKTSELARYYEENYPDIQDAFEDIGTYSSSDFQTAAAYTRALEIIKGGDLTDEEREDIEDFISAFEVEDF